MLLSLILSTSSHSTCSFSSLSSSSCSSSYFSSRDRKLTRLLCESLGNINCHTTMIFHVSDSASSYMETLTTMQLASRIHRTRNKSKVGLVSPPLQHTQPHALVM